MVHLLPLPGSPRFGHDVDPQAAIALVLEAALADAKALADGGVDAILVENFGDAPFFPGSVTPITVAAMTRVITAIRSTIPDQIPLGVNVLRNDGLSALAIAHACGCQFIRVNVLTGARVTDQGVIQGIAHDLLRQRTTLRARNIRILADVDVKHSAPLAERPLEEEVKDLIQRGLADAVVVSGANTGGATDPEKVRRVRGAAGNLPVILGSGVTAQNLLQYSASAHGAVVGTSLKRLGDPAAPVDVARVRQLVSAARSL